MRERERETVHRFTHSYLLSPASSATKYDHNLTMMDQNFAASVGIE